MTLKKCHNLQSDSQKSVHIWSRGLLSWRGQFIFVFSIFPLLFRLLSLFYKINFFLKWYIILALITASVCAGCLVVISTENEVDKASSDSGPVCCIHYHRNVLEKIMNISSPHLLNSRVDEAFQLLCGSQPTLTSKL